MFDTPSDFLYWSGTFAITIVSIGITYMLLKLSGGLGRINNMLTDVEAELPEAVKNIRLIIEDVRVLVRDATKASELVIETTEKVLEVTTQIKGMVDFVNENIISKLHIVGEILSFIFGLFNKIGIGGSKTIK